MCWMWWKIWGSIPNKQVANTKKKKVVNNKFSVIIDTAENEYPRKWKISLYHEKLPL